MNGVAQLRSDLAPQLPSTLQHALSEPGLPLPGREGLGGGGLWQEAAGWGCGA